MQSKSEGHELVVLDIPLLFEKDLVGAVDAVLVVTAPEEVQRRRFLAREGMTEDKLAAILAKQVCALPYSFRVLGHVAVHSAAMRRTPRMEKVKLLWRQRELRQCRCQMRRSGGAQTLSLTRTRTRTSLE